MKLEANILNMAKIKRYNKNNSVNHHLCLLCDHKTTSLNSLMAHLLAAHPGRRNETCIEETRLDLPRDRDVVQTVEEKSSNDVIILIQNENNSQNTEKSEETVKGTSNDDIIIFIQNENSCQSYEKSNFSSVSLDLSFNFKPEKLAPDLSVLDLEEPKQKRSNNEIILIQNKNQSLEKLNSRLSLEVPSDGNIGSRSMRNLRHRTIEINNVGKSMKSKNLEESHKCKQRNSSTNYPAYLKQHQFKRSGNKPHCCDECSYATNVLSNLRRHILRHKDEKRFQCISCGFRTKSNFKSHKNQEGHTDKTLHTCEECGLTARHALYLKDQKLCVGGEPHRCEECSYVCSSVSNLIRHKMTHVQPFECNQCPFRTTSRSNLKKHQKRHLVENQFHCDQCEYYAGKVAHLKKHIWDVHRGILFSCDQCYFQTKKSVELKYHKLEHHGGNLLDIQPGADLSFL